ncbi:MAG TPA: hypothetical protein VG248_12390 [Caulobacteraceae bacterium]|nr:hypothetical protein [Caulobacteraceae bacterium]
MNKINYALAMLSAAGASVAAAPAAQAITLYGTFTDGGGYVETFSLQSDGGVAGDTDFTTFALSNDSLGNTLATVGDNTTGLKATLANNPVDGYFGTGPDGSVEFRGQNYDSLQPALYTQGDAPVLQPGVYSGDFDNFTLTLSTAPEPDVWALLIAGAALVGGAARVARRRRHALG